MGLFSHRRKAVWVASAAAIIGSTSGGAAAWAQANKTTVVPVTGSYYEVGQLPVTVARIQTLKLPRGFQIAKFAEIQNPRMLVVAPDGTVYSSSRDLGTVRMLKDTNGDGVADVQKVVAEKKQMHGLAIHAGKLYMVTVKEVFVAPIKPDGTLGEPTLLISDLPDGGQHPNRTLAIGPDNLLYISVGSTTNVAHETDPESATIVRANLDGTNRKIFASGLRNTIGFGWHPTTKRLWGWDQGIDWLGDNEQGEEFNEIALGQKYGWPYVFGKSEVHPHVMPPASVGLTGEQWAKQSREPDLLYTAHSAGMQMAFYQGAQFPSEYRNDAFIALRGSWNRNPPSGYEVARVRFDASGKATKIEPFLTGFLVKGGSPQKDKKDGQFARLAGVAVARDGSLLVADDSNNTIYRVSYGATPAPPIARREALSLQLGETRATGAITVSSTTFATNGPIPDANTAYFADTSPQLSWQGVPANAKSVVVMMEDMDASVKPVTHWVLANLPPTETTLTGNLPKTEKLDSGAVQGGNVTGALGYYGPRPPAADPAHKYHFQVFALDKMLDLPSGFNRQALLDALNGHVVAKGELVGTYQRRPDVREKP